MNRNLGDKNVKNNNSNDVLNVDFKVYCSLTLIFLTGMQRRCAEYNILRQGD
jgi:hypothetical protein